MPHIHELYDFTVGAIIVYEAKVLFVKHPRYDKWLTPGGHIELDEDPEQALLREVKEETGLTVRLLSEREDFKLESGVKPLPRPDFMDVHEANPPHKHIAMNYILVAENDDVQLSSEHLGFAWLSQEDLSSVTYGLGPSLQHYAFQALRLANS